MSVETIQLQVQKAAQIYGVTAELVQADDPFFFADFALRLTKKFASLEWTQGEVHVPLTWRDHLAAKWRSHIGVRGRLARRFLPEPRYITYRPLEILPAFPELDKYRNGDRIAFFQDVTDYVRLHGEGDE